MTASLPSGVPNQMLIGGKWLDSDAGTFDVLNPATGDVLTTVPAGRVENMKAAVDAASAALPSWRDTAPRVRSELLRATWQIMQDNRENLARLMTLEMGKTLTDAYGEVTYSSEFFRWFAEEAVRVGGELRTAPSGANRILTLRQPIGVALLVTPWNFPAAMATRKIAPALAAGCTVVVKPAAETPLTTLYVASLMEQVGVPAGVVNVVTTDRAGELVDAALEDERVRKISFTGSTQVGRILLKKAAERVIASSMELGGNDPFLVLADADVDAAVEGAMLAKMRNGGQACTAANRFLVHRDVAEEFATKLAARMGALKMGPGLDDGVELGPMVSAKAVDGIADLVERSVAAGATALVGGTRADGPGFFYPPTVLIDVPADAPVSTHEIFGPVAPVIAVDSDDEALALANASEFGLVGYVYSRDLAHGLRISERLEVGMVGLNRGLVSDPAAPFGGVKESGLGREGGFEGIDEYLETKYIAAVLVERRDARIPDECRRSAETASVAVAIPQLQVADVDSDPRGRFEAVVLRGAEMLRRQLLGAGDFTTGDQTRQLSVIVDHIAGLLAVHGAGGPAAMQRRALWCPHSRVSAPTATFMLELPQLSTTSWWNSSASSPNSTQSSRLSSSRSQDSFNSGTSVDMRSGRRAASPKQIGSRSSRAIARSLSMTFSVCRTKPKENAALAAFGTRTVAPPILPRRTVMSPSASSIRRPSRSEGWLTRNRASRSSCRGRLSPSLS